MDQSTLIERIQSVVYAIRRGQTNQLLAMATIGFACVGEYLRSEPKDLALASHISYASFGLTGACFIALVWRLWTVAQAPKLSLDKPMPSAVKGLLPWSFADGELFGRLGRRRELESLLGLAQADQIPIIVVRGESGAGKTSLLQAGLRFSLGAQQCIYWEAIKSDAPQALLRAIRNEIPEVQTLDSLSEAVGRRLVLCLDQFEQLDFDTPAHLPIFQLLARLAKEPSPHRLCAVVGFRREYAADWLDFEQSIGFRAEQVAINLFSKTTASDVIATLADRAGFSLEQELLDNFIANISQSHGISPLDLSVGLEGLARFAQQRGAEAIKLKDYRLAGGAEGLLLTSVQEKLYEIPEPVRAQLLKGIVLSLIDLATNQRVATGKSAIEIAQKAEVPESQITPWLNRLTLRTVRLLEIVDSNRFRLPHDGLIPVLRRLAGDTLVAIDQTKLLFEVEYQRWRQTGSRKHLLTGKDLSAVLRERDELIPGGESGEKTEYLEACLGRRKMLRLTAGTVITAGIGGGYWVYRVNDETQSANKLKAWGLSPNLLRVQEQVDALRLDTDINDVEWIRSSKLNELEFQFSGTSVSALRRSKNLRCIKFDEPLGGSFSNLGQLDLPAFITSLSVAPFTGDIRALNTQWPRDLKSLSLDLTNATSEAIRSLKLPMGLTSLSLTFSNEVKRLEELALNLPDSVTSFAVEVGSDIEDLAGLQLPPHVSTIDLTLGGFESLAKTANCRWINECPSISINVRNGMSSPTESNLYWPANLIGLSVNNSGLSGSISTLRIPRPERLSSLKLNGSQLDSLVDLGSYPSLTDLTIDTQFAPFHRLAELNFPQGVTSLSIDLSAPELGGKISDVSHTRWPRDLKLLSLSSPFFTPDGLSVELEQLESKLRSLKLEIGWNHLPQVVSLSYPKRISVWVRAGKNEDVPKIPVGFAFFGVRIVG